jgi:chromosome segregation ATPase
MLKGSEVLGSIDGAVDSALAQVKALNTDIASLTERVVTLRGEQTKAYQSLARLRLSLLGDGKAVDELSAADRKAGTLLAERDGELQVLDADIEQVEAELATLGEERSPLVTELDQKTEALETAEAAALRALYASESYLSQEKAAQAAEAIAHHADQKLSFAGDDRATKGKSYEDDPLFAYLWRRGWGTPRYEGGFVARFFDAKVARLIDFDKARPNYAMLLKIPKRLSEHAKRCRDEAEHAARRVEDMQTQALGVEAVDSLRVDMAECEARLEKVDDRIEGLRERRLALTGERALLLCGEDKNTREALGVVVMALQRKDVQALRQEAQRTPTPDDDTLVDRIDDIDDEVDEAQATLETQKTLLAEQQKRISEIERLRHDYRHNGYGRDSFDFRDVSMIALLLGQVLGGGMSGDRMMDQMTRRRRRRVPGGIGRGFPGMGRSGGFGGGGFRTGGRMGGGGFRTGGGF